MVSDTACKTWTPLPYYMETTTNGSTAYHCNPGDTLFDLKYCYGPCPVGAANSASCAPIKAQGPGRCEIQTKNPIHISTGNKYLNEKDYVASGNGNLNLVRFYNNQNNAARSTFGTAWRHGYDSYITPRFYRTSRFSSGDPSIVLAVRANGNAYAFTVNGTIYTSQDADVADTLTAIVGVNGVVTGWTYRVAADDSVETYNAIGKLVSIQNRAGHIQTLTYSDGATPTTIAPKSGLLIRIADAFGRQLNLTYDSASRIATMTDPANGQYLYTYGVNNNLASVTYPDLKTRTYLYNEAAFTNGANLPHALTGITDENGVRYASYYYTAQGKAYKEHHAGGVNQYQIGYSSDGASSTITDPLGTARTTHFTTILGVIKATGQSQPGGAGCGPASSAVTYDANGNVATRTDFNGNVTTYTYDLSRNLETSRTEAFGTAHARTITTTWHPTYRLPVTIAEPQRITINDYDDRGNLLTKTVQATSDATGAQGLSAAVTGTPRSWTYTYNEIGQVLTARGPRTDVNDLTSYAYDPVTGDLVSITNPLGHVTTLSHYDANGRVGRIVDANGLTTDLQYSPRGWLTSRTVTGNGSTEATGYDYDGVGQLKKVTLPDGSWVGYDYDNAHRLTATYDGIGNRISYTLDAMGNRLKEEVRDPSGTLARQTTRIYDALNRLKTITGGTQ